jgi:hypothetical protein
MPYFINPVVADMRTYVSLFRSPEVGLLITAMDDEIILIARRLVRGIEAGEDTLPIEAVTRVVHTVISIGRYAYTDTYQGRRACQHREF